MPCLHCFDQYVVNMWYIFLIFIVLCFCFAFVSLPSCGAKRHKLCVARPGFSTVYVTLCLRYSMYWFPRYNVSFRQHFSVRQSHNQRRDRDQDQDQDHFSNSDEEVGIARRRVPRRTSSEIASAKIAGRPIPAKVRKTFPFASMVLFLLSNL